MTKKDLIPYKHLLLTRNNNLYWYVGEEFDKTNLYSTKKEYLCMYTGIDLSNEDRYWKNNLLANRDGYWANVYEEPRKYDVLFVFEIVNNYEWFRYYRSHEFIEGTKGINSWCSKKIIKKIWERIDCEMEY